MPDDALPPKSPSVEAGQTWDDETVPIPGVAPEIERWMARQHQKTVTLTQRLAALHDYVSILHRDHREGGRKLGELDALVAARTVERQLRVDIDVTLRELTSFQAAMVGQTGTNGIVSALRTSILALDERVDQIAADIRKEIWGEKGRTDEDKPVVIEARAGKQAVNRLVVLALGCVGGAITLAYVFGTSGQALRSKVEFLETRSFARIPELDRELTVLRDHVTKLEAELAKKDGAP